MTTPLTERPPPSVWAVAFATAILAALAGFLVGQGSSIGLFGQTQPSKPRHQDKQSALSDDEDETEEEEHQDLQSFKDSKEPCKLVLVVRTDLGMTKGKIAAQCGHATLACYKALLGDQAASSILQRWERFGQAKIAVQVKSEEELHILHAQAVSLGVCARTIHDAGRTQIAAGSATVLGVGPAPESMVNQITGGLKLL